MSADNYYVIRRHPNGGFAAVMGFASEESTPAARHTHPQFAEVEDALSWANGQYSEYGVSLHPEVTEALRPMKDVLGEMTANVKRWRNKAHNERHKRQSWRKRALDAEARLRKLEEQAEESS